MYELNCLYILSFHHFDFRFHFKISFSFTHSVPVADPNYIHLTFDDRSKLYSPDWTPPAPPVPVSPHAGGEAPSRCWTRLCSHPRQAAAGRRVVTSLENVQHNLRHSNRFHNFNNKFSSVRSASTLRINGFPSTSRPTTTN